MRQPNTFVLPVVSLVLFVVGLFTTAHAVDRLPDLVVRESDLFDHDIVTFVQPGRTHIRVSNGTANAGEGPLYLRSTGVSLGENTEEVAQRIYRDDGTYWERVAGQFIYHPFHSHTHVEDWCIFRLREVTFPEYGVGPVVASGEKTSFCIIDLEVYDTGLPFYDPSGDFFSCGGSTQGLSVGWIDIYSKDLQGQNIDITGIPDGYYWLESEVDPENHFVELDETNNATRILIVIGNPGSIAQDAFEPNDSHTQTNGRPVGGPNSPNLGPCNPVRQVTPGSIHQEDNDDYYKFYLPAPGTLADSISVTFQHGAGDLDLQLLNSSGQVLLRADGSGNKEGLSLNGAPAGWYYAKVYGYRGATSPAYTFAVMPSSNGAPTVSCVEPPGDPLHLILGVETYRVDWTSSDPENNERWVSLWVGRDADSNSATELIPTSLHTPALGGFHIINTAYLDTGLYHVGLSITDGGSTTWDWSANRIGLWHQSTLGVLRGFITDLGGAPLSGARIALTERSNADTTSLDGQFLLTQLPPVSYTATVTAPGYADTTLFIGPVPSADTLNVSIMLRSTCTYLLADINGNGEGGTIADLTYFVGYLFQSGPAPVNMQTANINGTGGITVADLTYFVSYIFGGGPPPLCTQIP